MLNPGTYNARGGKLVVSEKESGAVMVEFICHITNDGFEGQTIPCRQCLAQKDGTISEITVRIMREIFNANSLEEVLALQEQDLSQFEFEIEVVHEEYEGKVRDTVKYVNKPGGSGRLGTPADPQKLIRQFASRYRALAGGTAAKPAPGKAPPAPARQATPPPPQRQAPPPPPRKPAKDPGVSTEIECWEAFVKNNTDKKDDELNDLWAKTVDSVAPGKSDLTPADWGKVKAVIEDNIPY